ncbi:hypothetical protein C5167_006059 [Papaver somniferum]|uniref:Uncharacterized protein n=1 Tax=Papaver somniferum TaxID=3469 RepID=A0A4Y7JDZ3_PAPSO|nr:hypothetical protein C5167_006059 [Papaver somniferum]
MKEQQQQKNMVEEYHHDMFPVEELEVLATTQFSSFLQFAGRKRSEEQLMS